jgi:di/tricarboxylate transporter
MFDFAPVGLGLCAVGFIFLCFAPRLIHVDREPAAGAGAAALAGTRYVTELGIDERSRCAGSALGEVMKGAKNEVRFLAVVTPQGRVGPDPTMTLRPGDSLVLEGDQAGLDRLAGKLGLKLLGERHRSQTEAGEDVRVIEGVVRQQSKLIGRSVAEVRLHERYGLSLIAVAREGRRFDQELRSLEIKAGDLLILKADEDIAGDAFADLQILPLTERGLALGYKRFGYGPTLALGVAVVSVALGAPIALAFAAAAVAVLLLRTMSMSEAYRAVQGPTLVLLAALIPISESISSTGGDRLIAAGLSHLLGSAPPFIAVGLLIVAGMAVTPFLNNAATVLIMAPIAAAVATALQASLDTFLMAVAIGAACDFLTPIGHQCNTIVMGPGGYRFFDYWRLGLPLSALVVLTGTPLILFVWPVAG